MKKRIYAALLTLALFFSLLPVSAWAASGMENFAEVRRYTEGHFSDIGGTWFEGNVARSYALGLVDGKDDGLFAPYDNITLGEVITLAARLHSTYYADGADFTQGTPWYQVYVDYCLTKGILEQSYADYNQYATRAEVAVIFAHALPTAALSAINTVEDAVIPDVTGSESYGGAVYTLYRAGILTGSDSYGTFRPKTNITRAEMAAILARMADENQRKSFSLAKMNAEQVFDKCAAAVFYIEVYDTAGNATGSGSGVFLNADGLAVTNYHVIEGAASAKIKTSDGTVYSVLGAYDGNDITDLALLQIDGSGFSYLERGDSDAVKTGETVFAIGSPLGMENTISSGIISNNARAYDGQTYLQTTASISSGSSGGALINARGQLIGITCGTFTSGQNLNLAVPANLIGALVVETLRYDLLAGSGSTKKDASGTLSLSADNLTVKVGGTTTLTCTAKVSGVAEYFISYSLGNDAIANGTWGTWNGNSIRLTVNGVSAGSTKITLMLYSSDGELLDEQTIPLTITDSGATLSASKTSIVIARGSRGAVTYTYSYSGGSVYMNSYINNTGVATGSWGSWDGNSITFTLRGKSVGTTSATITLCKKDGTVLATQTLLITVCR